ncbi:MAG: aldo/keto reductase [Actinobacteria bacterium]|nr:aldo/keto reductase [Actinomycetota bacterium]
MIFDVPTPLPTRAFGRHPDRLSIIGLGGGHLSRTSVSDGEAVRLVHAAMDAGITFLDNAWDYGMGVSETRYGQALKGRRDRVFLMTKVCARDRATALRQLDESLRRLQTDYVDLWQFHEVNYDNDPEWICAAGGALEAAWEAKRTGTARYIGFTGHKSPHILRDLLARDFPWDACQMPVNVFDSLFRSFARELLPELNRRGVACLGMKALGGDGQFVTAAGLTAQECRRYALSQPISTLICGMVSHDELRQDLAIARTFTPMTAAEQQALRERVRRMATDGRHEWFKTTTYFDHVYHRDQHGFPPHAESRNR